MSTEGDKCNEIMDAAFPGGVKKPQNSGIDAAALHKRHNKRMKKKGAARKAAQFEPPSKRWETLQKVDPVRDERPGIDPNVKGQWDCMECYINSRYMVNVDRFINGFPIGDSPWCLIGISNVDQTAKHDWRDFQRIKNDVCGDEWEAVEMYPAESRLNDPSNYFFLWAVPRGVLSFGLTSGRRVLGPHDIPTSSMQGNGAFVRMPQRAFAVELT